MRIPLLFAAVVLVGCGDPSATDPTTGYRDDPTASPVPRIDGSWVELQGECGDLIDNPGCLPLEFDLAQDDTDRLDGCGAIWRGEDWIASNVHITGAVTADSVTIDAAWVKGVGYNLMARRFRGRVVGDSLLGVSTGFAHSNIYDDTLWLWTDHATKYRLRSDSILFGYRCY